MTFQILTSSVVEEFPNCGKVMLNQSLANKGIKLN